MQELSTAKMQLLFHRLRLKVNNVLENKLAMHWVWVMTIWIICWFLLHSLAQSSGAITWIGMGLMSVHITYWVQLLVVRFTPKRLIKNTSDKAVLITGCDTGFGHHLAVRLDKLGFTVYAGCLYPEGEGAKQLGEETSDRVKVLEIDVTNKDTIQKAFKVVSEGLEKTGNRLWAVVNNAGVAAVTEVEWCPLEVYKRVFDVNSLGPIRITKTFLPLLRRQDGNRIIIVASLAGRYTFPGFTAYSMSKHAAVSFADGLRLEMRKWKISVHTVEPTLYRTPIAEPNAFKTNLDKIWEECPEEVRKSYGPEYLKDFKRIISNNLARAKPIDKIREVVDDMVDSVAGEQPKVRYVPSFETQLRAHLLGSLSSDVLDNLLCKSQPQTPPADLEGFKRTRFAF